MTIEYEFDQKKWDEIVKRIERTFSKAQIDKIMRGTAFKGLRVAVIGTPKKTGATQRSWYVAKAGEGEYKIATPNKVALFLEEGTKAHGPKRAKFLYIPLRPGAATWRKGFVFGKDYILVKRVKGITARRYFKPVSEDIMKIMVSDFTEHLKAA
jgi:hypothetical protein